MTPLAPAALDAYLQRIGLTRPAADAAGLAALHRAHVASIPFENLDIHLGRPILLDLDSLLAKLVGARRGGYCFEQNTLFAAVLATLGFAVTPLAARVCVPGRVTPRTHMLLEVRCDERDWLADVGFGGNGLLAPLPLAEGAAVTVGCWQHRLARDGDLWVLQGQRQGDWHDLYAFTRERQQAIDYEMASYYTSTHPSSRFVTTLTAQRLTPAASHQLRGLEYVVDHGTVAETRQVTSAELVTLLRDVFGLELPPGSSLRGPA